LFSIGSEADHAETRTTKNQYMPLSPFAAHYQDYARAGVSVIPIIPNGKAPGLITGLIGWQHFCEVLPDAERQTKWAEFPDVGIGIALGPASGLVALDFDEGDQFWPAILDMLPPIICRKVGKKGFTAFFRYSGEKSTRFVFEEKIVLEILSNGKQTVIPPSLHPVTHRPYIWEGELLLNVLDKLPVLPAEFPNQVRELIYGPVVYSEKVPNADGVPSLEMVRAALQFINPDLTYLDWIEIGFAINTVYPGADGLALFDAWSSGGMKYKPGEPSRKWGTFNPALEVTIATLFNHAKLNGFEEWSFDENKLLEGVSETINSRWADSAESIPLPPLSIPKPTLSIPAELIEQTPGLVGDIVRWIVETSREPLPILALGGALATVAALKAHRVKTESDLRTNLYCLGLAGTGRGKGHIIKACQLLLRTANAAQVLGGEPGSEPGLLRILNETNGRTLLLWDEIGHAVSSMADGKRGNPHYAAILHTMTKLFSEADGYHAGKVLADGSRSDIIQPCLSVYGTTVPERFFQSLTSMDALDGWLPRWLMFEVPDGRIDENQKAKLTKPHEYIIDSVRSICELPTRNPRSLADIQPTEIPFTTGASDMWWSARKDFRDYCDAAREEGNPGAAIWARAAEHAAKLALVVSDGPAIDLKAMQWALEVVYQQSEVLAEAVNERISENDHEKSVKRVHKIIRDCGSDGINQRDLTRRTQYLKLKEREEVIMQLIRTEQIKVVAANIARAAGGVTRGTRGEVSKVSYVSI
jgi:hypothetical protein